MSALLTSSGFQLFLTAMLTVSNKLKLQQKLTLLLCSIANVRFRRFEIALKIVAGATAVMLATG